MKSFKGGNAWTYAEQNLSADSLAVINIFIQLRAKELQDYYFTGFESSLQTAAKEGMVIIKSDGTVKLMTKALRKLSELLEAAKQDGDI